LLRYWAERRIELEAAITRAVGQSTQSIDWIYPSLINTAAEEPAGLDFVAAPDVQQQWKDFWPQRGSRPRWDSIARLYTASDSEWLLIEAKANQAEFCTPPCRAAGEVSREQIRRALSETKGHLGVHHQFEWMGSFYQHANRLAVLHFLSTIGIRARLIEVLFVGDEFPDHRPCPSTEAEWRELLRARQLTLGLPDRHAFSAQVHEVFLPALAMRTSPGTSSR
jgi:hypothetical protein